MSLLSMVTAVGSVVAKTAMNGQAGGGPLKSGAVSKALSNMNKRGDGAKMSKAVRPTK